VKVLFYLKLHSYVKMEPRLHFETYQIPEHNCREEVLVEFLKRVLREVPRVRIQASPPSRELLEDDPSVSLILSILYYRNSEIIHVATLTVREGIWDITFFITETPEYSTREVVNKLFNISREVFDLAPTPIFTSSSIRELEISELPE